MISYLPYIFSQLIQPLNLLLMVAGTAVGIIFGAIPGLSGTMAVMLFMPLTYTMESSTAIIFLLALWIGGCSGAFIGSVLLGIPGSASAVATCWDGHPMAKKGLASKALAIGQCSVSRRHDYGTGDFQGQHVQRPRLYLHRHPAGDSRLLSH